MRVAVADYGAGNLRSLSAALTRAGAEPFVTIDADEVREAPLAVVAGVGHVASAAAGLARNGGGRARGRGRRRRGVWPRRRRAVPSRAQRPGRGAAPRQRLAMVKKRVIPCLDVAGGRVVKGVRFEGLRDMGDPVDLATRYS